MYPVISVYNHIRYSSRPLEGREHVTLRSAIPTRYNNAKHC